MAGKHIRTALIALALTTCAATSIPAMAQALHAGTLDVPLNKSQVVTTDRPIARAMIGGPSDPKDQIADVVPITDRSLYVLGKKMGTTSLTLYDAQGRVISIMDIAVGPDVIALEEQLRLHVPGEQINASISNESVVLTGLVNSAGSADRALQLARSYAGDNVINLLAMGSSQQIMLEVRFAEVNRDTGKEIGVRLSGRSRGGTFDGITGKGSGFVPGVPPTVSTETVNGVTTVTTDGAVAPYLSVLPLQGMFGVLRKSFGIGDLDISAMINALESRGLAKTLAQPTLIALSGEKASFLAGGEFPVPVNQRGVGDGSNITVEFKPFGVSLAFTPTILGDRTISMIVEPEVSAIDPQASLKIGDIIIPGLRTRRVSTTLELRDGESFAIAGLISKEFETTVEQIPVLGSIPIIGSLFRSSSFKKGETELLIVVTPHLVAPLRPEQVRLPTDRVIDPRESDTFLLGQPYHPVELPPVTDEQAAGQLPTPAAAEKDDGYAY